jgi:N-acetylmuramoyl-L-alanine amidase
VVLAVARQLRERLEGVPGLRVLLTRDGDYFVPLHERVRKARRVGADLFVSIHADAFLRREARGASVFVLSDGAASSAAARWMAQRENAADAVGGLNVLGAEDLVAGVAQPGDDVADLVEVAVDGRRPAAHVGVGGVQRAMPSGAATSTSARMSLQPRP